MIAIGTERQNPAAAAQQDASRLLRENEALKEENNLLKLKVGHHLHLDRNKGLHSKNSFFLQVEILLDMLAQKTAESELVEADVHKMRSILANT